MWYHDDVKVESQFINFQKERDVVSEVAKFSLRLPKELNLKLKQLADKDSRSLNNYIIKVLEEHVNKMEQHKN